MASWVAAGSDLVLRRSFNHQNIGTSISNGVWVTQAHNEKKLADAFDSGAEVRRLPLICVSLQPLRF